MSEWLRSLTRNQMGSARTGSNPVRSAPFFHFFFSCGSNNITTIPLLNFKIKEHRVNASSEKGTNDTALTRAFTPLLSVVLCR